MTGFWLHFFKFVHCSNGFGCIGTQGKERD